MARDALTLKQTAFLNEYLTNGGVASKAYRVAYKSQASAQVVNREGNKLLKHPLIAPHVERVRLMATERLATSTEVAIAQTVTREYLVGKLQQVFEHTVAKSQAAGAARLGELIARLHGMIIDRKDVRRVTRFEDLDDEELEALARNAPPLVPTTEGEADELPDEDETRH